LKIIVTGGCGFIGSNLAEALVEENHEVIVLDNYLLGSDDNIKKIKNDIQLVKGDIRDANLVNSLCKGADIIFNQAAASSSPMFIKNLTEAVSVNINGFATILNAAKENNIRRVIYASTSSVYGNLRMLKEDMPTTPPNFYAATKLSNEYLATLFSQMYEVETIGFRYMSVYGPHEEAKGIYANLVSQFLWAVRKNESPVIYGNGTQTRDFVYVKDVVAANLLAMKSKKKLGGEVLNVGTGKSISLNDLVKTINKILGKEVEPKYISTPMKNYIFTQKADTTKAKKTLGFVSKYNLEDGIKDLIKNS
jgi:UDP-glucose 4-epimerase